jgi:hypothetical protein
MEFLGKYEIWESKGGSEEGGWWFDEGEPQWQFGIPIFIPSFNWLVQRTWKHKKLNRIARWLDDLQHRPYRWLNDKEHERQKAENHYGYHSVLSHRDTFYSYKASDSFKLKHFPETKPHYE